MSAIAWAMSSGGSGSASAFDLATMAELRDLFENLAYREPLPAKPADDLDVVILCCDQPRQPVVGKTLE